MTKDECREKINSMLPDVIELIKQKTEHYLQCGAVETEDFKNDYILPKAILHVCLIDASEQYRSLWKEGQAVIKNLKHF